jgi:hypothetical protein
MIVYSPINGPTAHLLKRTIRTLTGVNLPLRRVPELNSLRGHEILINYGISNPALPCEMNSPSFVALCSHKKRMADLMLDNGINAPRFIRGVPTQYPAVVRHTLTGFGGSGIEMLSSEPADAEPYQNSWWTPFQTTESEFRIHVLGGQIKKVAKKDYRGSVPEEALPVRSHDKGYFFSVVQESVWTNWGKLTRLIEKLNTLLPARCFYGLDVGYSRSLSDYYVFEANSLLLD